MAQSSFSNTEEYKRSGMRKGREERGRIGGEDGEGKVGFGKRKLNANAKKNPKNGPFTFHRGQGDMKC